MHLVKNGSYNYVKKENLYKINAFNDHLQDIFKSNKTLHLTIANIL